MHIIGSIFLAAAAGMGGFFGLFGANHAANSSTAPNHISSTTARERPHTAGMSVDLTCVITAVSARETALSSAIATETTAINAAYSTRASALTSAFSQSGPSAIRQASQAAWTNFQNAIMAAHKVWKGAQQTAWTQFKSAIVACGGSAPSVSDAGNANMDQSAGGTTAGSN